MEEVKRNGNSEVFENRVKIDLIISAFAGVQSDGGSVSAFESTQYA
jgi:hypothetical protein